MPVLARIAGRFASERPLGGMKVAACLHVTAETANLMRCLLAGGAHSNRNYHHYWLGATYSGVRCGEFKAPPQKAAGTIIEDEDTNQTVEQIVAWLDERKLI